VKPSLRTVAIVVTVLSVAAVGVVVALVLRRGGEPVVEASIPRASVTTVSPNPELTASAVPVEPEPLPPVAGAIPVPAFPPSDIPWLEVGPGWFVVVYDADPDDNSVVNDAWARHEEAVLSGAVMLVSPTGDLYYVDRLDGRGRGEPIAWTSDGLVIVEDHVSSVDRDEHTYLSTLSLTTGERSAKVGVPYSTRLIRAYPDGQLLVSADRTNSSSLRGLYLLGGSFEVKHRYVTVNNVSPTLHSCTPPSSDGTMFACLVRSADGKSDIWKFDVATGKGAKIDEFRLDPDHYYLLSWWDEQSFAFIRYDADWTESTTSTYNVVTKKVHDVTVRFEDGTAAGFRAADIPGYRVLYSTGNDARVEIDDFAGKTRATLPCIDSADASFGYLLTTCYDGRARVITVTDLASGESATVARYPDDAWDYFPYGDHIVVLPFTG